MKKPFIIMTGEEIFDNVNHRHYYMTKRSYSMAVSAAGGAGLMAIEPLAAKEYAQMADGLLLTDGIADINPARYGDKILDSHSQMSWYDHGYQYGRDSLELTLCKAFIEAEKPILGIGRGMYIINTVFGGKMYQDLEEETGKVHPIGEMHSVKTMEGNPLSQILPSEFLVNSYHHQAIKTLAPGLCPAAAAEDGVIEAFVHESMPIIGVQWNPETLQDDDENSYSTNRKMTGKVSAPKELMDIYWENQLTMTPDEGFKTDSDVQPAAGDPIFRYFVEMCRK